MAENNTTTAKSLWSFPSSVIDRTAPVTTLREQAAVLADVTNQRLSGRVSTTMSRGVDDPTMTHTLTIFITAHPDMTFEVLDVRHPLTSYPATIRNGGHTVGESRTHEDFEKTIGEVLRSGRVQHAVACMLAQSSTEVSK